MDTGPRSSLLIGSISFAKMKLCLEYEMYIQVDTMEFYSAPKLISALFGEEVSAVTLHDF